MLRVRQQGVGVKGVASPTVCLRERLPQYFVQHFQLSDCWLDAFQHSESFLLFFAHDLGFVHVGYPCHATVGWLAIFHVLVVIKLNGLAIAFSGPAVAAVHAIISGRVVPLDVLTAEQNVNSGVLARYGVTS